VHYAALSALSCVHEDVKHNNAGYLLDGCAPGFLRTLVAILPRLTRRNARQALETLIQAVQAVPLCMEDPDVIHVRAAYFAFLVPVARADCYVSAPQAQLSIDAEG
jgi:hypothetical protein